MTGHKVMKDFKRQIWFSIETVVHVHICILKYSEYAENHFFSECLMVLSGNKSDQSSFHWSTTKADHCRWRGRIQLWWRHAKQGNKVSENDQREVSQTRHKMHTVGMDLKKSYALKIGLNWKFWFFIKETLVMHSSILCTL